MLYGLSLNTLSNTLLRWDTDLGKVVAPPITWRNGMDQSFDSCMLFQKTGFHSGSNAIRHFLDTDDETQFSNLIQGVSANLLDADPTFVPAMNRRMGGDEILRTFFTALGTDLKQRHPPVSGDGEHMLVVNTPAVMSPEQESRFLSCVQASGIPAEVQPGWFLQTLAYSVQNPDLQTGRVLFLDFGADESCAVAMLLAQTGQGHRITPRSIAVSPSDVLSHTRVDHWISERVCANTDTYCAARVPFGFRAARDGLAIRQQAELCRRYLMDSNRRTPFTFSVANLYRDQYIDTDGLNGTWLWDLLREKGFASAVTDLIDRAMTGAGWTPDQLDAIYISRLSGSMFRRIALEHLGISEGDPRCPLWRGTDNETAEGAALYAKLSCVGHSVIRDPVTRFYLCCRTSCESEDRLWHYIPLFSYGSMRVPCIGASYVEFFALDAAISEHGMSNNRGTRPLSKLPVPPGYKVSMTVYPDGTGGFTCKFTDGSETVATEVFRVNLTDA